MVWKKATAISFEDLIEQIIAWMTDKKVHGDEAWEVMRHETWPRGTIFKVKGLKGKDHFYIGMMPLDISVGSTYRNWFMKKENLATNFVWSHKGANKKLPFTISGNTITLRKLGSGMKPYLAVTGGWDIWNRLLKKLEGNEEETAKDKAEEEAQKRAKEVRVELQKGKPRSFEKNRLLIVFNTAYPKQRIEKKEFQAIIKAALKEIFEEMLENEEIEEIPPGPFSVDTILESPYVSPIIIPDTYKFATMDIFSHAAKVLYFGIFKQYAPELDWYEQPGGMEFPNLPLMTLEYYHNSSGTASYWNPPVFPGAGYPAIGMDPSGPITGKLDYYLIKNDHGLTLVTNNKERDGKGNWETVFAGLYDAYADYEYPLPAAVVGGTSGATMKGETRYPERPVTGIRFDYRPKNWSLIHGMLPFGAAALDSPYCPTQAAVMLPDGTWKQFANYVQGVDVLHFTDFGRNYYAYPTARPKHSANIRAFIRPAERDISECTNIYDEDVDENSRKSGYKLEPIEFLETGKGDGHHILGRMPNYYHATRPIYWYGELVVSGKRYLVLPNVWEKRKFHLDYYTYRYDIYEADQLLAEDKKELARRKTEDMMNLFIRLEEEENGI